MNRFSLVLCALLGMPLPVPAAPARVDLQRDMERGHDSLQLIGEPDEDWWVESSTDLQQWVRVPGESPMVSGTVTNAPVRKVSSVPGGPRFYRARRTAGLYDPEWIREIRLQFDFSDWEARLIAAHGTTSSVPCRLESDNGVAIERVGARYKGYSSFSGDSPKKSLNVQVNAVDDAAEFLGFETFNLNNAFGDATLLREPIYFNVMQRYAPSPKGALAKLFINGENWGVYSLAQQEDSDLIKEWFPNASGDRWRSPNKTQGSSFNWLGSEVGAYTNAYELKKTADPARAWSRLVHAIDVLNNTPLAQRRDALESVFAVDSWLWFLAVEILFTDDDSYFNKGADFSFYFDAEAGRIHPVQHDGNEAFVLSNAELSPTFGEFEESRPLLSKVLVIPELRQRYLAHLRTVLDESFEPSRLTPEIDQLSTTSRAAIAADPKKSFTMAEYDTALLALKEFVTNRYAFLKSHPELSVPGPLVGPVPEVGELESGQSDFLSVRVTGRGGRGVGGVWLWYRAGNSGPYTRLAMRDDGAHFDGAPGDSVFGVQLASQLAGTKVHYYVEARDATALGTATFEPPHAELRPKTYRVTAASGGTSPVVINELMADNAATILDPQGEADDWIELRNLTDATVDLSGWYLSDEPGNPRKWRLPDGTQLTPHGYLLVWADEDGTAPTGLHASFKLSAAGETLTLVDTDARRNVLRDSVEYGPLGEDVAWGRRSAAPGGWGAVQPSPGAANP